MLPEQKIAAIIAGAVLVIILYASFNSPEHNKPVSYSDSTESMIGKSVISICVVVPGGSANEVELKAQFDNPVQMRNAVHTLVPDADNLEDDQRCTFVKMKMTSGGKHSLEFVLRANGKLLEDGPIVTSLRVCGWSPNQKNWNDIHCVTPKTIAFGLVRFYVTIALPTPIGELPIPELEVEPMTKESGLPYPRK